MYIDNHIYKNDINYVAKLPVPWDKLDEKTVILSGATGLIGSFFVDVIMAKNNAKEINCNIIIICRDEKSARKRFDVYDDSGKIEYISQDIINSISCNKKVDYVLHLASNTHPIAYATEPVKTITTNVIGTMNMLEFASTFENARCVFASSNEIYGENRGDTELFDEEYCGYIDCNTLRAGYPESKRCGEALCQAYIKEKNLDVVIVRFTRSFGPTMKLDDSKALSQFLKNALAKEDIVLKSEGNQYYSYTYVADAVAGLVYVMLLGETKEAYNIADEEGDITLKNLAGIIAKKAGTKVVFDLPDAVEQQGFSKATKARLDGSKLKSLGWRLNYTIEEGIENTLAIIKNENK